MNGSEPTPAEEASAEAVAKQRDSAQAVEAAREAQLAETIKKTATETKAALIEGLKEVFDFGEGNSPDQTKILVQRIPFICQDIKVIHLNIADINENIKWTVRLLLGALLTGLVGAMIAFFFK